MAERCGGRGEVFPHPPDPESGYIQAEQCRGCPDCQPKPTQGGVPEGACKHERGRPAGRPVPDQLWSCPDCGERVGYSNGTVLTVRELNDLVRDSQPRYSSADLRQLRKAFRTQFEEDLLSDEAIGAAEAVVDAWHSDDDDPRRTDRSLVISVLQAALSVSREVGGEPLRLR